MIGSMPEAVPENRCFLDSYLATRKAKGVIFQATKNSFTKSYSLEPSYISKPEQKNRFLNELTAYQYFKRIGWKWSPRLISYSDKSITIERKRYESIHESLHQNKLFDIDKVIKSLKELESDLIAHGIECNGASNKDILLGPNQVWLVDFEVAKINKRCSRSLFVELSYDLSRRWHTYYSESQQKNEYRKKLYAVIIRQLFSFKNLRIISNSFYRTSRYRVGSLTRVFWSKRKLLRSKSQ